MLVTPLAPRRARRLPEARLVGRLGRRDAENLLGDTEVLLVEILRWLAIGRAVVFSPDEAYRRIEMRATDSESCDYLRAADAARRSIPEWRSFIVIDTNGPRMWSSGPSASICLSSSPPSDRMIPATPSALNRHRADEMVTYRRAVASDWVGGG